MELTLISFVVDYPALLSSPQLGSYLRSYARNFDLYPNIEFGKTVTRFERNKETSKWQLTFEGQPDEPKQFDKVVWATGGFINPRPFAFEGQDQFAGRIIHSQDVRNLEDFKGQNVIVSGIGNTAGDIALQLVPHAKTVYLSHRRGAKIISTKGANGMPVDTGITHTVSAIVWWIEAYLPSLFGKIMDMVVNSNFKENWGENQPEWGFANAPSMKDAPHSIMCNEGLIPHIKAGTILSTPGIKRITGPRSVELTDGSVVDADTIIACFGYNNDLEVLSEALTVIEAPGNAAPLPNLYMGIFPPEHADSLAIVSNVHLNAAQIPGRELAAMALAQIWIGNSALPSRPAMDAWVRTHQDWLWKRIAKAYGNYRGDVLSIQWMKFVHDAAGTALYDNIGWSWNAWKLWWKDAELYKALAHGVATPHAFRLFETGKRSAWEGARQAILDANSQVRQLKETTQKK